MTDDEGDSLSALTEYKNELGNFTELRIESSQSTTSSSLSSTFSLRISVESPVDVLQHLASLIL